EGVLVLQLGAILRMAEDVVDGAFTQLKVAGRGAGSGRGAVWRLGRLVISVGRRPSQRRLAKVGIEVLTEERPRVQVFGRVVVAVVMCLLMTGNRRRFA